MPSGNIPSTGAAATPRPLHCERILAPRDRDSIYYSKERWRIVPQRLGPLSIQYLLIDAHHDEIVATYPKMSEAMDHRLRLDGRTVDLPVVPGSKCEEMAHE
jgi:hypothetical protein